MIVKKNFFKLPESVITEQKLNPLTRDLYLCELCEYLVSRNTTWSENKVLEDHMLVYCTKGGGIIYLSKDMIPFSQNQFCIVPAGFNFGLQSENYDPSVFLTCKFNGEKTHLMEKDFAVVRDLIASVNNMVANRNMLFNELFNNLTRGYHNANYIYINLCFGHLLATFIYASRTSDDLMEELNPGISRAIKFMEQNLNKKLFLDEIAFEAGYSLSYFTTIFRRKTGYSPLSYFTHLKISKACEYLDFSSLKIKEISSIMGYSDAYYFSKDFQKKIGQSPRNYRKRVIGKK